MPRTARLSGSAATPRQSRGPTTLPTYEPATHALNRDAQNALHDLPRNHKLESLRNRLQIANEHLTSAAADVNDRLHAKTVRHEKIKKRQEAASSQGSNAQDDEDPKEMRMATEDMTDKLDQRIQDMIDAIGHVANVERVLKELDMNATNNRGVIAPTQSTIGASQFRGPKRRRLDGDDADDEEDSQVPVDSEGLYTILQRKESDHEAEYQALSLAERYATHNDYVGFKKMVHDARHPGDNAPPLPHHSTWFPSEGNTTLDTSFGGADMTQIDEDEDFQVAAERISVKCPITLLTMKDPVQSTKCPHNFEKSAILQMINLSEPEDGRRGGVKSMKCPQCETVSRARLLYRKFC